MNKNRHFHRFLSSSCQIQIFSPQNSRPGRRHILTDNALPAPLSVFPKKEMRNRDGTYKIREKTGVVICDMRRDRSDPRGREPRHAIHSPGNECWFRKCCRVRRRHVNTPASSRHQSSVVVAMISSRVVVPSIILSMPERRRVHIPSSIAWARMASSSTWSPAPTMSFLICGLK